MRDANKVWYGKSKEKGKEMCAVMEKNMYINICIDYILLTSKKKTMGVERETKYIDDIDKCCKIFIAFLFRVLLHHYH